MVRLCKPLYTKPGKKAHWKRKSRQVQPGTAPNRRSRAVFLLTLWVLRAEAPGIGTRFQHASPAGSSNVSASATGSSDWIQRSYCGKKYLCSGMLRHPLAQISVCKRKCCHARLLKRRTARHMRAPYPALRCVPSFLCFSVIRAIRLPPFLSAYRPCPQGTFLLRFPPFMV